MKVSEIEMYLAHKSKVKITYTSYFLSLALESSTTEEFCRVLVYTRVKNKKQGCAG